MKLKVVDKHSLKQQISVSLYGNHLHNKELDLSAYVFNGRQAGHQTNFRF